MFVRNIAALSLVALLSACATTEPVIRVVTQRVEVPVPVPCKTPEPVVPVFNVPALTENDTVYDKAKAFVADNQLHKGYEIELLAALRSCK